MRRRATFAAFAVTVAVCALFGCSLIAGLDHFASFAIESDAGVIAAPDADAAVADACVPDASVCVGRCGVVSNGCGGFVACGGCPAGQTCGATPSGGMGAPNVCATGTPCVPTCEGKKCGASDSCDGICAFGDCPGSSPGLACVGGVCKCGPGSCSGCCGKDGQCHSGVGGPGGCGTGGVDCVETTELVCASTCGGNGQRCCTGASAAACMHPLVCEDGGYCGCTPRCDPGTPCGHDDGCGGICQGASNPCAPGQRCVNGGLCVCDPLSCEGCCNGSVCEEPDAGMCGIGGVACAQCSPSTCNVSCGNECGGYTRGCCSGETCVAPLVCDPTGSCTQCQGSCVGKACGEGDGCGNLCNPDAPDAAPGEVACGPGLACAFDPEAGTALCACSSASCREGCCIAGVCINGNDGNPALCGLDGGQCRACATGQVCSGGLCQAPSKGDH